MKKLKIFLTLHLPVILWMMVIFFFSSRQRVAVSETYVLNFAFFKTLHLIEYSFLFFLSRRALKYGSSVSEKQVNRFALLIVFLYACTDEFHQRFVPTREGAFRDVIIDCLGASITWIIFNYSEHILPKKLKHWLHSWQIL